MNELFAELERKLAVAYDNKSFLVGGGYRPTMGKVFCWLNGPLNPLFGYVARTWTPLTFPGTYDHSIYTAQANNAVITSIDATKKICRVDGRIGPGSDVSLLPDSLEAHTKNGYYIMEQTLNIPEKKYLYAVAELVYEGFGFASVFFPANYNKYNFFRIHNLNTYWMRFTFSGSGVDGGPDYEVQIPPLGMKTVRRSAVRAADYNSSWSYLWRFMPEDPRFFVNLTFDGIYATMAANNVTNPAGVLYEWIENLRRGIGINNRFYLDEHEHYDVAPLYSPDIYPDPADTTQLIGNFFHHKGNVKIFDTTIGQMVTRTFNGYGTIATDLPEITFTDTGTALRMDAIAGPGGQVSTNLFNQNNLSTPTIGTLPQTLDHTNTGWSRYWLYVKQTASSTIAGVTFNLDKIDFNPGGTSAGNLIFHVDQLSDVLSLNAWGDPGYTGTDQVTNIQTFPNRELKLTPWGPRIHITQDIQIDGSPVHGTMHDGGNQDIFMNPMNVVSDAGGGDVSIEVKSFIQFEGWGWGRMSNGGASDNERTYAPGYLSARTKRVIASPPSYPAGDNNETGLVMHPHILNDLSGIDGADFDLRRTGDNYIPTEYAFQAAIDLDGGVTAPHRRIDKASFNWWGSPDSISTWPTLVPLLCEHFNAMAAMVNSVKKVKPIDFSGVMVLLDDGFTYPLPGPNFSGICGSGICPREMYCGFGAAGTSIIREYEVFMALGIPIYTAADLPSDLTPLLGVQSTQLYKGAHFNDTITAADNAAHDYTATRAYDVEISGTVTDPVFGTPIVDALPLLGVPSGAWGGIVGGLTFFWVKINDVKAKAEELGWKFFFQQTSHPYSWQGPTAQSAPTLLFGIPSGTASYGFHDPVNTYTVGQVIGGDIRFTYHDQFGALIEDPDGEWKGPITSSLHAVADMTPGDINPIGFYDPVVDDVCGWTVPVGSDDVLLAIEEINTAQVGGRRNILIQEYYSDGFTNHSKAILCPVNWVTVAQSDYSAISKANFKNRLDNGKGAIACMEAGKHGVTATQTIDGNDDTVVQKRTDGWDAVVPFWDCLIAVES